MSGSYGVKEIIAAARRQNQDVDQQLGEMKTRDGKHKQEMANLQKELNSAWANLTEQLVPSLEPAVLDAAAARLMLPTAGAARVQQAMAHDRQAQEAIIRSVESNPIFVQRKALELEYTTRLREMNEFIEPLVATVRALEKTPHFRQLYTDRYGTAAYDKGWLTLSYYRDWKNGDELVATFGQRMQAKDFAELSARYRDEHANLQVLENKADTIRKQQSALQLLVQSHAGALDAIAKLPERHLTLQRSQVREHLERLAETDRLKVCNTPALELASKRISGVTAKVNYLEGLHREMVLKPREDLMAMKAKNDKDIQKLMLPKKRDFVMPAEDYNRRFRDRHDVWNKRWDRYDNTRTQIIIYDRYDRYDPISNFLWWDVMTDGRLDGNFIPEVHHHHDTFGSVHHHDDAVSAVASDSTSTVHHSDIS